MENVQHNEVFRIEEALQFGWKQTKEHFGFLLGIIVILFVSSIVLNAVGSIPILGVLIVLAGQTVLNIGTIKITLALARGQKLSYKELFTNYQKFWPFLGASVLFGLAVAVGIVLLIIPGIIAAIMLQFFGYLIVDKNMGAIDSLKESARVTKGHRWQLFWFMLTLAILNIIGALLFGVGLIVTTPLTMMAAVYVYQKMTGAGTPGPISPTPLEQTAAPV